jgi:hypothetical protein
VQVRLFFADVLNFGAGRFQLREQLGENAALGTGVAANFPPRRVETS